MKAVSLMSFFTSAAAKKPAPAPAGGTGDELISPMERDAVQRKESASVDDGVAPKRLKTEIGMLKVGKVEGAAVKPVKKAEGAVKVGAKRELAGGDGGGDGGAFTGADCEVGNRVKALVEGSWRFGTVVKPVRGNITVQFAIQAVKIHVDNTGTQSISKKLPSRDIQLVD